MKFKIILRKAGQIKVFEIDAKDSSEYLQKLNEKIQEIMKW